MIKQSLVIANNTKNHFLGINEKYEYNLFEEIEIDKDNIKTKILNSYNSDHCRHTTLKNKILSFKTNIKDIQDEYNYWDKKIKLERNCEHISNYDLATFGADKYYKDNPNAPIIPIDGTDKFYTVKNETHNFPTQVNPFDGASTCIGGAIRDIMTTKLLPLACGRISGTALTNDFIETNLKQEDINDNSLLGSSWYGNNFGIANIHNYEKYHKGYAAKKLELGFVIGFGEYCETMDNNENEAIILIGGLTQCEGVGGATNSSSIHTDPVSVIGYPVIGQQVNKFIQKNKIKINKVNDLGAGGIAISSLELFDGFKIDLEFVPSYGIKVISDLLLSESQERMLISTTKDNVEYLKDDANNLGINFSVIGYSDNSNVKKYFYRGKEVAAFTKDELNYDNEKLLKIDYDDTYESVKVNGLKSKINDVNFDNSINIELMSQSNTCAEIMLPIESRDVVLGVSSSFNPELGINPFINGQYAILKSISDLIIKGYDPKNIVLTSQQYFKKFKNDNDYYNLTATLLGARRALRMVGVDMVGGKDSMSGTRNELDVPNTFITMAYATRRYIEKSKNNNTKTIELKGTSINSIDYDVVKSNIEFISKNIKNIYEINDCSNEDELFNYSVKINCDINEIDLSKKIPTINGKFMILDFYGTNGASDWIKLFKLTNTKYDICTIKQSESDFIKMLDNDYDAIIFPGGFSFEDLPSCGEIISLFINKNIEAFKKFLENGKIIGICNGFQGILHSKLIDNDGSKLTINDCKHHISKNVILSNGNEIYVSHKYGNLTNLPKGFREFATYKENINGSYKNIESICSDNILLRMGHVERINWNNILENKTDLLETIKWLEG